MAQERLARHVLLTKFTEKRPRGRPRTRWSDHLSDLAWFRLGVDPELSEIAVDREVSRVLRLLHLRAFPTGKAGGTKMSEEE